MTLGGGPMAVGDFSKYEKKLLTFPNAANTSTWEAGAIIPCSFTPKLVICTTPDDNTTQCIYSAAFCMMMDAPNYYVGAARARGKNSTGILETYYYYHDASAGAKRFKYEGGTFYACRASASVNWNPSKTYTVEIYG